MFLVQTMLWEIGKQIQLMARLFARNYGLEWSEGPVVTTLTELNLREWYEHVWRTVKWIQLHILSYTRELCYLWNLNKLFPLQQQSRVMVKFGVFSAALWNVMLCILVDECLWAPASFIFRVENLKQKDNGPSIFS